MIAATEFFGIVAATVTVATMVPYIRDTLRGATVPHRGTWLIWSVLAVVASLAQRADGASWSVLAAAVAAVLNVIVLVLAARRGVGGHSRREVSMIALAGVGVVGWMFVGTPLFATVCVVVADAIGLALMVPKVYFHPESETVKMYAGAVFVGGFAAVSVGRIDVSLLVYPVYYSVSSGAIASLIVLRRRGPVRRDAQLFGAVIGRSGSPAHSSRLPS